MKSAFAHRALLVMSSIVLAACGDDPVQPVETGTVSGVIRDFVGAPLEGATVTIGTATTTTDSNGEFEIQEVPVGFAIVAVSAPGSGNESQTVTVTSGTSPSTVDMWLPPLDAGTWSTKANLLVANSEFALTEANGKLYLLGGYPSTGIASKTVQVYDIAADSWQLGPELPLPNNHNMAATVGGKIYVIGGQTTNNQDGLTAVDKVFELDPAVGTWVEKAPMPTARSGGVAVALDGKIYVAGGRVPRGNDFAVYDPATNEWEELPPLPSQRNHLTGVAIDGRIHIVGGRLANGLSPLKSDAHEVFNPATKKWSTAAPMLRGRSGMNSTLARGCFHVWGGEAPSGMTPDHDIYDPRTGRWWSLANMTLPIHGVVGSAFVNGLIWVTGGGIAVGGGSGSLHNQTYLPSVSCE